MALWAFTVWSLFGQENPEMPGTGKDAKDNPCLVHWHIEDVQRFWEVYDRYAPKHSGQAWQSEYIEPGSPGLQAFLRNRIENGAKLAKTLKKHQEYYEQVRQTSLDLDASKAAVCEAYSKLQKVYPEAVYPDIYFVIGRRNTGGTAFSGGLVIGIERFGKPTDTFQPDIPLENLEFVIVHEMIHFQQKNKHESTLLAQCLKEGTADFLGELFSGKPIQKENYRYGNAHEEILKKEFQKKMQSNNWQGWLYYMKDKSRPQDLGYWMGYQICQAFYEQAQDKEQAIRDMLQIQDYEAFVEKSRYFQ